MKVSQDERRKVGYKIRDLLTMFAPRAHMYFGDFGDLRSLGCQARGYIFYELMCITHRHGRRLGTIFEIMKLKEFSKGKGTVRCVGQNNVLDVIELGFQNFYGVIDVISFPVIILA